METAAFPQDYAVAMTVMVKKNPFVMTIGFNRHDPAHVEAAQPLNGMEQGKAQDIVDVLMAHQNGGAAGIFISSGVGRLTDYDTIRKIVLQVMEERENGAYDSNMTAADAAGTASKPLILFHFFIKLYSRQMKSAVSIAPTVAAKRHIFSYGLCIILY